MKNKIKRDSLNNYVTKLENEFKVTMPAIKSLFKNHKVFVLGYGSLLYSYGWWGRGMRKITEPKDLIECKVEGYERGMFGKLDGVHFYGVVENNESTMNGVLNKINTPIDWINLMITECIYIGILRPYNYRVVDITSKIKGVVLPKNAVVHMVANETQNKIYDPNYIPAPGYYERVWKGVSNERKLPFIHEFLATGGINF